MLKLRAPLKPKNSLWRCRFHPNRGPVLQHSKFDTIRTTGGMSVKFKSVGLGGLVAVLSLQWMAPAQDDLGRQAQTIFAESCYGCHGAGQQMDNLRLDTNAVKAIIPGDSANSLLMKRITGAGGLARMPL